MHPIFRVALAQTQHDLYLAQRLRYDVFVSELGAGGLMVDHQAGVEQDRFDPYFDHLLLFDDAVDAVVGGVPCVALRSGEACRTVLFRG